MRCKKKFNDIRPMENNEMGDVFNSKLPFLIAWIIEKMFCSASTKV